MNRLFIFLLLVIPFIGFGQSKTVDTIYVSGYFPVVADDQTIDTFEMVGTILRLSILDDQEATKEVDISSVDTDTYVDSITWTLPKIYLWRGGTAFDSIDISTIDTTVPDDQTLSWATPNLSISEGNSVDLSALYDDTQIDSTGIIGLGFVAGAHTVDTQIDSIGIAGLGYVAGAHTVDTQIDSTGIAGLGYVAGAHTVDTDDQTIDQFTLASDIISLSLEDDGQAAQTVDISTYDVTGFAITSGNMRITEGTTHDLSIAELLSDTVAQVLGTDSNGKIYAIAAGLQDDQTIDVFSLSTNVLSLSLDNDGEATKTVTFTNWDTDDTDDLTTSTNFGGDVSGTYNAIVVNPAGHTHSVSQVSGNQLAGVQFFNNAGSLIFTSGSDGGYAGVRAGSNITITQSGNTAIIAANITSDDNQTAAEVPTSTGTFNGNLSGADTDVQKALETIDDLSFANQNLSLGTQVGNVIPVNISGGTGVNIDVTDDDNSTTNEIQVLTYTPSTDVITLSSGGSIDITEVNTDAQTLTATPQVDETVDIEISNGNTVEVDIKDDDHDTTNEQWKIKGDDATAARVITGNNTLSIRGEIGSPITTDLSGVSDVLYINTTAEQNVQADWNEVSSGSDAFILNKPNLSLYQNVQADWNQANSAADSYIKNKPTIPTHSWGTLAGIPAGFADNVDDVNDADANTTNEIQTLSLAADQLSLTSGGSVDLSPYLGGGIYEGSGTVPAGTVATQAGTLNFTTGSGTIKFDPDASTPLYITGAGSYSDFWITLNSGFATIFNNGGIEMRLKSHVTLETDNSTTIEGDLELMGDVDYTSTLLFRNSGTTRLQLSSTAGGPGGTGKTQIDSQGYFYPAQINGEFTCTIVYEGMLAYDRADNKLKVCTDPGGGFQWVDLH